MRLALALFLVIHTSMGRSSHSSADRPRAAAARPRPRRGGARAFTIPELLAVVIIIGIFAAAASPMFIEVIRDRAVSQAGMNITGFYRLARSRALGRGAAVLVRWEEVAVPGPILLMREAVAQKAFGPVLVSSCAGTNWDDANESREVTRLSLLPGRAEIKFVDDGGVTRPQADVCFTPRGRTFARPNYVDALVPLAGVPKFNVRNTATNVVRTVLIPPNGVARMGL
jgi:type IV fimbrial biogenesis protein FimT